MPVALGTVAIVVVVVVVAVRPALLAGTIATIASTAASTSTLVAVTASRSTAVVFIAVFVPLLLVGLELLPALFFLFLVVASRHLFEPLVRDLVRAVHDAFEN